MALKVTRKRWMARWQGNDLTPSHLCGPEHSTRAICREWIETNYGYFRTRPDLLAAPFHWRVPRAVRVTVTVKEIT